MPPLLGRNRWQAGILYFGVGQGFPRHLVVPTGTPMTNLMLSLMDRLGVKQERLGDSTGRLPGITA